MGFIIIFPVAALSVWAIISLFRWLRRGNFGAQWWRAFFILGAVGLALGIWFAFFLQYKVANNHMAGFPIPAAIETREKPDAPWQKSNMPLSIRVGAMITDVLSGVALGLAPLAVAAFFKENTGQGAFKPPHAP